MKSNPGPVPYMCREELQIEPFSTCARNKNKIPSLWVHLPPCFGIHKLVKKKDGTDRSSQAHLQLGSPSSPWQGLEDMDAISSVHVGSAEKWAPAPLESRGSSTGIHWSHLSSLARTTQIQCLFPEAKGKLLVHLPDLLADMDWRDSCNTLCSITAEAGSWKEKLTESYVLLKFLLPLSCNSFSLLSVFLNIFEFIWFLHFLPLFL